MLQVKCNKCYELLNEYTSHTERSEPNYWNTVELPVQGFGTYRLDLCDDCMADLAKFFGVSKED